MLAIGGRLNHGGESDSENDGGGVFGDGSGGAPFKSEFVGGEVFAMSGGRPAHSVLIGQMARELGDALEDGPCGYEIAAAADKSACRIDKAICIN